MNSERFTRTIRDMVVVKYDVDLGIRNNRPYPASNLMFAGELIVITTGIQLDCFAY